MNAVNFNEHIKSFQYEIEAFRKEGKKIFATSSFQTNSVVLLHLISTCDNSIPIYFLNTGYLFPETLQFKDQLIQLLGLNVQELKPLVSKHEQIGSNHVLKYISNPDECCEINKIQPLELIKTNYDVWMSGVRSSQTQNRSNFQSQEITKTGLIRYHPILSFTNKMVYQYINHHNLPKHPLEMEGYVSIGCVPCTSKFSCEDDGRNGRWKGSEKTECGLHIN